MIEVSGRLCRGAVYFSGESIKCKLLFRNIHTPGTKDRSGDPKYHTIAWASAQIICFCNTSPSRVVLPESFAQKHMKISSSSHNITSLTSPTTDNGYCVLQTELKFLFCDLQLSPGQTKEVEYCDIIPKDGLPSYRGPSVKYSYKIVVAMQRVGGPVRVLRIPFRVLVLYGLAEFLSDNHVPKSTSIFIPSPEPANLIDVASEVLSTITSRKAPHDYRIANANGPLGVFTLLKSSVRLGEDIIGIFDFSSGKVRCMQFTVFLQSEEDISEDCRRRPDQGNSITSYEKLTQFCLYSKKTHIAVPVPLHCSPGFLTEIVGLKWKLCFEFIVIRGKLDKMLLDTTRQDDRMLQGPSNLDTDTVTWELSVKILPTMPPQAETAGSRFNACKLVL